MVPTCVLLRPQSSLRLSYLVTPYFPEETHGTAGQVGSAYVLEAFEKRQVQKMSEHGYQRASIPQVSPY